jgi:hypothetical protein
LELNKKIEKIIESQDKLSKPTQSGSWPKYNDKVHEKYLSRVDRKLVISLFLHL